jgi:putative transcriptional regulator
LTAGGKVVKNQLQTLRKQHQWSQADLARELGVSRQAVNGFESGKFDPSLDMAFKIAHLLDVPIETIFTDEAKSPMKLLERLTNYFGLNIGFERFSPEAIAVVQMAHSGAIDTARAIGDNIAKPPVEPAHLLLGLLADADTISAQLLQENGVKRPIRSAALVAGNANLSSQSQFVMEMALQIVRLKGKKTIAPEHLLWGLMRLAEADRRFDLWQDNQVDFATLNQQLAAVI